VVLGLLVGVYGATYTLYFLFTALVLALLFGAVLLRHEWGRRHGATGGPATSVLLVRMVRHAGAVGVPALLVTVPVWGPYLLGVLGGSGMGTNVASHFLPSVGASFPLPFLHFSIIGALCMVGLLWLVAAVLGGSRYRAVACALAVTVAGCYLWYLLSALALLANTTLLAFRLEPILVVALVSAGSLAVLEGLRLGPPLLAARWQATARALPALLGLAVLLAQLQGFPRDNATVIDDAFEDYYPSGHTASGASSPADADAWVPRLASTILELTRRAPDRNVVAGSDPELLFDTHPYWRFQAATIHYANPLSGYQRRNALLRDWSTAPNGTALRDKLDDCPVAAPTVFVFQHSGETLTTKVNTDIFPRNPNVAFSTLTFHRAQFDAKGFTSRDVGPFTVVALSYAMPV
jgi:galactan 5-O-arabinofuranosyltransferase